MIENIATRAFFVDTLFVLKQCERVFRVMDHEPNCSVYDPHEEWEGMDAPCSCGLTAAHEDVIGLIEQINGMM